MSDNRPPKINRYRRWWKIPLYAMLLLVIAFTIFRYTVHRRVVNRLNDIRDAGYPVTLEELDAWYPTPDGPNAADVYQKAFDAFPADPDTEGVPIVSTIEGYELGQPLDEDMAEKIKAYLAQHAEAIALLEEASKISGCKFPVEWSDGLDAPLPHLFRMRQSARLLTLQSILDVDHGDYDRAADLCIQMFGVARSLDHEPLMICSSISLSIHALALEQVEQLIQTGELSDMQLQSISDAILTPDEAEAMFSRALAGERCIGHARFQGIGGSPSEWGEMSAYEKSRMYLPRYVGIEDLDHAYWLDYWAVMVEEAADPVWPPHDESWYPDPPPAIYVVSYSECAPFGGAYRMMWRARMQSRVFITGIAVERHRLRHGTLPKRLDDLAPELLDEVPIDPFDGQPLRYRVEADGAIIYSIGTDETDNRGRRFGETGGMPEEGTDITFTFGDLQSRLWPIKEQSPDPLGMGMKEKP